MSTGISEVSLTEGQITSPVGLSERSRARAGQTGLARIVLAIDPGQAMLLNKCMSRLLFSATAGCYLLSMCGSAPVAVPVLLSTALPQPEPPLPLPPSNACFPASSTAFPEVELHIRKRDYTPRDGPDEHIAARATTESPSNIPREHPRRSTPSAAAATLPRQSDGMDTSDRQLGALARSQLRCRLSVSSPPQQRPDFQSFIHRPSAAATATASPSRRDDSSFDVVSVAACTAKTERQQEQQQRR